MIHHAGVLDQTIHTVIQLLPEQGVHAFIFRTVYGTIQVVLKAKTKKETQQLKQRIRHELHTVGPWLELCLFYTEDSYLKPIVLYYEEHVEPTYDNIWVIEEYLTNRLWNDDRNIRKMDGTENVAAFYSFKGGVGRTTSMVMTAFSLVRRGKIVVLVDFDLESPGVACLFPDEVLSEYGLLDYLIDYKVLHNEKNTKYRIRDYLFWPGDVCQTADRGGDLYVLPAHGAVLCRDPALLRKSMMRFDFNLPLYNSEDKNPLDSLFRFINRFICPDYILVDTRSGLHQISGITLSRCSALNILFFRGDRQNVEGMKILIPYLEKKGTSWIAVHAEVPAEAGTAEISERIFQSGLQEAISLCDRHEKTEGGNPERTEPVTARIHYNPAAVFLPDTDQLLRAFEECKEDYEDLADRIIQQLSGGAEKHGKQGTDA